MSMQLGEINIILFYLCRAGDYHIIGAKHRRRLTDENRPLPAHRAFICRKAGERICMAGLPRFSLSHSEMLANTIVDSPLY